MRGLDLDATEAMERAGSSALNAYAPYSNFHVGAAVLTEGGSLYTGCNVENASYGLSACAERNAVAAMVSAGGGDREIKLVAVASPDAEPCFPCGACRQVLREFGCKGVVVKEEDDLRYYPFDEILPNAFGPESL